MTFRTIFRLALAICATTACGGGDYRLYRISVDAQPLLPGKVPASCYATGTQPSSGLELTGNHYAVRWAMWDGPDGKRYLNPSGLSLIQIGDTGNWALPGDLIEGKDKSFAATAVSKNVAGSATTTVTRTVNISFTEMAATAKGTVDLAFKQECQGCMAAPKPESCAVSLSFTGAEFQADQQVHEGI